MARQFDLARSVLFAFALSVAPAFAAVAAEAQVAAASDLKFALDEVVREFAAESRHTARVTYGSSGTFTTQIRSGAPFGLFLSADESYVAALAAESRTRDAGALYAIGRIVVFAATRSPLGVDAELNGLRRALAAGSVRRFAIADPAHAPYGKRAEEALRHAGLWDPIAARLVRGENVSQAAQFALSGSAQGGIIALSLVLAPPMAGKGTYALIPQDWHAPLRQRMVLLQGANEADEALFAFLQSPRARRVMQTYGFTLPGQ